MSDFSRFSIDELNHIYLLRSIIEFSYDSNDRDYAKKMLVDKFNVSYGDDIVQDITRIMFDKLNDFLRDKYPSITLPKIKTYVEYPDYSCEYTLDDILITFNVVDDIGIMYSKLMYDYDICYDKYVLTEKTYGSFGNITPRLSIILYEQCIFKPNYICEEPGKYLLHCGSYLILLKEKIDLEQHQD